MDRSLQMVRETCLSYRLLISNIIENYHHVYAFYSKASSVGLFAVLPRLDKLPHAE